MKRALFMVAASVLLYCACTVKTTGAPCITDNQCPTGQICEPSTDAGLPAVLADAGSCVSGERPFASACSIALQQIAAIASRCYTGPAQDWLDEADATGLCARLETESNGGKLGYSAQSFGDCSANLANVPCSDFILGSGDTLFAAGQVANSTALLQLATHCAQTFVPQSEVGAACESNLECPDGYCQISQTCPGACRPYVKPNGSCGQGDVCAPGSTCVTGPASNSNPVGTCVTLANVGEACAEGGKRCSPYLVCDAGLCQDRPGLGEACGGQDGGECQLALRCKAGKCAQPTAEGQACTKKTDECGYFFGCASSGLCTHWPTTVGSSCSWNDGIACAGSTYCPLTTNKCAAYQKAGDNCSDGFAGAVGSCGPEGACKPSPDGGVLPTWYCVPAVCGG